MLYDLDLIRLIININKNQTDNFRYSKDPKINIPTIEALVIVLRIFIIHIQRYFQSNFFKYFINHI